jgi:hypothetical protein
LLKNYNFKNSKDYLIYDTGHFVCLRKLKLLKKLINEKDLKVVIISSWAVRLKGGKKVCEFLDLPYFGEALSVSGGFQRWFGIKNHIEENKISEHIIVDDAGYHSYENIETVVNVKGSKGLRIKDIKKAKKILKLKKSD